MGSDNVAYATRAPAVPDFRVCYVATSGNARLAHTDAANYERPDSDGGRMRENPCVPGEMARGILSDRVGPTLQFRLADQRAISWQPPCIRASSER